MVKVQYANYKKHSYKIIINTSIIDNMEACGNITRLNDEQRTWFSVLISVRKYF